MTGEYRHPGCHCPARQKQNPAVASQRSRKERSYVSGSRYRPFLFRTSAPLLPADPAAGVPRRIHEVLLRPDAEHPAPIRESSSHLQPPEADFPYLCPALFAQLAADCIFFPIPCFLFYVLSIAVSDARGIRLPGKKPPSPDI